MNIWVLIALILFGAAAGLYLYGRREQTKLREAARREEARYEPEKEAGPGPSSRSGSASGWLRSLVKAKSDERKTRNGLR